MTNALHFEFLDNSVPQGQRPSTVAFGTNEMLNVLDVKCMLDIERFRKVDIDATSPAMLYPDRSVLAPEKNTGFLEQCVALFHEVTFADQVTGRVYLRIAAGVPTWVDGDALQQAVIDADTRAGLTAVAATVLSRAHAPAVTPQYLEDSTHPETTATLGRWATLGAT